MTLPAANAGSLPPAKRARMQPPEPGPPGSSPGPSGFGRPLSPVAGRSVSRADDHVRQAGISSPAALSARDYASGLPAELLALIFNQLPLSFHGTCALVCRHWYSHLPDIRLRIVHWLKQHPLLMHQASTSLVAAFASRLRPWLARHHCRQLPVLQRLHQDWLEHKSQLAQDGALSPGALRAARWLTGCLLYTLHQQWRLATPFELKPVIIEDAPARVYSSCFSDNGLWLALDCSVTPQGASFLWLYGWRNGRWCKEPPLRRGHGPVSFFCFHRLASSERLLTVHQRQQIVSWTRDAAGWYPVSVYRAHGPSQIRRLVPLIQGDLLSSLEGARPGVQQFLFSSYLDSCQSWEHSLSQDYHSRPDALALLINQLAVAVGDKPPGGGRRAIHIWRRGLSSQAPTRWACQISPLWTRIPVQSLFFSPDGSHLLGLMQDRQRLHLWAIDGQGRLQPKLTLPGQPATPLVSLGQSQLFSQDSQRLAVPVSLQRIQFWDRTACGNWHSAETLQTATGAPAPGRALLCCQLSGDGQALLCVTDDSLSVWCKTDDGHWHWRQELLRATEDPQPLLAPLMLLPWGGPAWVTVAGHEGRLRIDNRDSLEQQASKACWTAGRMMKRLKISRNGLFLTLFDDQDALILLDMIA